VGQPETPGRTEEAKTATGAVNFPWPARRSIGLPHLHLRRHYGWFIENAFRDLKQIVGAGQQQVRDLRANVGAFHLCLWTFTMTEVWAWDRPQEELTDHRRSSPWDDQPRRPSHADKRRACRREFLADEFNAALPDAPNRNEIRALIECLLDLAD
jgi:hypothetical protein